MNMKIILIGMLSLLLVGCTTNRYYPTDVNVEVSNPETMKVDISKDNTQVNISVQEEPRELVVYRTVDEFSEIGVRCYDNDNLSDAGKHHLIDMYESTYLPIEQVKYGGKVVSYYNLDANYEVNDFKIMADRFRDYYNVTSERVDWDCYIYTGVNYRRLNYIDGILISNSSEYCSGDDIMRRFEFRCSFPSGCIAIGYDRDEVTNQLTSANNYYDGMLSLFAKNCLTRWVEEER